MDDKLERDLGVQPISDILEKEGLNAKDLVNSSTENITLKMVKRACKGRRLTPNVRMKILNALISASGKEYKVGELFNYIKPKNA